MGNRNTKGWKALRERAKKSLPYDCHRCGAPIDPTLSGNHPQGPHLDHIIPVAGGGDDVPASLDEVAWSHRQCNQAHGGRIGQRLSRGTTNEARAAAAQARRLNDDNRKPVLYAVADTPARPCLESPEITPGTLVEAVGWPGLTEPRLMTARPSEVVGSLGGDAADWIDSAGIMVAGEVVVLRPWQRFVLERALEVDEAGRLVHDTVLVTVPRQQGKSILMAGLALWRMNHPHLFGDQGQSIVHVANRRVAAERIIRVGWEWADARDGWKSRRGRGSEAIAGPGGAVWEIQAANNSAGVGGSYSMVLVDEAWEVEREVFEDALSPTTRRRQQPQKWLISTAGDSSSDLLMHYRDLALTRGTPLLIEWSAPGDADIGDPNVWRAATPWWDDEEEHRMWQAMESMDGSAFRRQMLNIWVQRAEHWLPSGAWEACRADVELPAGGRWFAALEMDFDGTSHALVTAGWNGDRLVTRLTLLPTLPDADAAIEDLRRRHPDVIVVATPSYGDRLTRDASHLVGQREAVAGTQALIDLISRGVIVHDGDPVLAEHIYRSVISRRQSGWSITGKKSLGASHGARALLFAVSEATKRAAPTAAVITR